MPRGIYERKTLDFSHHKDAILAMLEAGEKTGCIMDAFGFPNETYYYKALKKFGFKSSRARITEKVSNLTSRQDWVNKKLYKCTADGKRTNWEKDFSFEERLEIAGSLETPDYCPYLEVKLDYFNQYGDYDNIASLDRINSDKGYEKGNLQIISWKANRIKNNATAEDVMKVALAMAKQDGK